MNPLRSFKQSKRQVTQEPWLTSLGLPLSDTELKIVSRNWDLATWDRFLARTVEKEFSRNETLSDEYDSLLEETTETVWPRDVRVPEQVHKTIHEAIRELTLRQRQVVQGVYFLGLSHDVVAQKMKIARQTVTESKKLSLNKIKGLIQEDPAISAYLIGGSANLPQARQTKEQQLRSVYREDLNGSYMK